MSDKEKFDFEKVVLDDFKATIVKSTLKDIFNADKEGKGHSTKSTRGRGVYALFYENELMKIGRAITGSGIFTRMSQYYRQKDGKLDYIDDTNKDKIIVWYFNLVNAKDCWAAEKYLQAKAYYAGEKMEWDDEVSSNS